MRILVTGANGYIGKGVVKTLLDDGNTVLATDLKTDNIDERAVKFSCDLFGVEDPYNYFQKPDVVLHLAWRNGFIHDSKTHIEDFSKHYFFLEKLACSGVKKIAVMGTMHEVGFHEGSIDENTPCNPLSYYGIAKNALRNAVKILCKNYGVEFQWLRAFYIVGNTSYGSSIFSKLKAADERGDETFPFTTGLNQWDFIDYDDFCLLTASTIEQNSITGIINVCSGRPEKLSTRVERFILDNQLNIKLEYGKYPDRPYDSKAVWGDSKKIEKIMLEKKDF